MIRVVKNIDISNPIIKNLVVGLLTTSIFFLHSGITYYISFQMLAMVVFAAIVLGCQPRIDNKPLVILILLVFNYFVILKGIYEPNIINASTNNITKKIIGIGIYSAIILMLFNLKIIGNSLLEIIQKVSWILLIIFTSLMTYINLSQYKFWLLWLLELKNRSLVVNLTPIEVLQFQLIAEIKNGYIPRMGLYYGEPSYLALVIFTITGSLILINFLKNNKNIIDLQLLFFIALGVICLILVKSLSSFIYLMIIILYVMRIMSILINVTLLIAVALIGHLSGAYNIILNRILDLGDSLSFYQRFYEFKNFVLFDYIFGLNSDVKIPSTGFNNGISYIIAISGLAGISLILSGLIVIKNKLNYLNLFLLISTIILAIIMQNGGIFSPNKIVLLCLIILPLAINNQSKLT